MAESTENDNEACQGETVLVIDDDARILVACRGVLDDAGYCVLLAEDGREGIEIFRAQHDSIDVIILDWILPSMSGDKWLDEILAIDPQAKVVFTTGQFMGEAVQRELEVKVRSFLKKPFAADQLLGAVQKALGGDRADPGE